MKTFFKYTIRARDGEVGEIDDFFFDDTTWTVRYLVVKTGNWLTGRKVLLSPDAVTQSHWEAQQFEVNLTREQVKDSPDIDTDQPVSLQSQIDLHNYYGWGYYWTARNYVPIYPLMIADTEQAGDQQEEPEKNRDPHLRSAREVMKYHLQATDGDIGHVEDFLVEDESWAIHYMVVDTRNWLPGKRVLIAPRWIRWIRWDERLVAVNITQESVKNSPEYLPSEPVSREYEDRLHDHYNLPKYWEAAVFASRESYYSP
jgi:hypothetical protein